MSFKSIILGMDSHKIRCLDPSIYREGTISNQEVTHVLKCCDALWLHSGDPKDPHVELTDGQCSNGFIDVLRALRFTNLCRIFAIQLANVIRSEALKHGDDSKFNWVIGSDHAGAAFSHSVAMEINALHDFTEKGPDKTQLWKRLTIEPEDIVLQVEDIVTTTKTLRAVREGIRNGNLHPVRFAPFVAVLVHRSNVYEFEKGPIRYLVHYDIDIWKRSECPLCVQGSKRLRPKENWAKLTQAAAP